MSRLTCLAKTTFGLCSKNRPQQQSTGKDPTQGGGAAKLPQPPETEGKEIKCVRVFRPRMNQLALCHSFLHSLSSCVSCCVWWSDETISSLSPTSLQRHIHIWTYEHTYLCTHIHTDTNIYMYTYIYIYIYMYMYQHTPQNTMREIASKRGRVQNQIWGNVE